jgi:hypothetical protein
MGLSSQANALIYIDIVKIICLISLMIWKITQRILILISVVALIAIVYIINDVAGCYDAAHNYTYTGQFIRVDNNTGIIQSYNIITRTWGLLQSQ